MEGIEGESGSVDLKLQGDGGARVRASRRDKLPKVKVGGVEVERVEINGQIYVLSYIRCGKACAICSRKGRLWDVDRPGHGPYWYRLFYRGNGPLPGLGKLGRQYIGKKLIVRGDEKRIEGGGEVKP